MSSKLDFVMGVVSLLGYRFGECTQMLLLLEISLWFLCMGTGMTSFAGRSGM